MTCMSGCTPTPPESTFWKWFVANEDKLLHFESSRETTFKSLSTELKKVDGNLSFEFGNILRPDGTREFTLSAGGIAEAFPAVESLYSSAPRLPKWTFVKFRQRKSQIFDVEYSGRTVFTKNVRFALFPEQGRNKLGIFLLFDGYSVPDRRFWQEIAFMFLDQALGEHDVTMKVGTIDVDGMSSQFRPHSRPITELAKCFDETIPH